VKLLGLMTCLLVAGILIPPPAFALAAPAKSAPGQGPEEPIIPSALAPSIARWWKPVEQRILEQVIEQLHPFWPWANLNIDWSEWTLIRYRADYSIMAGAAEIAEIDRYFTARAAAEAFGEATGRFHGYPAKLDRLTQVSNGHYQDARWIEWLAGRRIFRVRTSYNSTYPGEARDPAIIAEVLFDVAVRFGLLTDEVPPIYLTPYPTVQDLEAMPSSHPSSPVREK
jgi:hypothetical protein